MKRVLNFLFNISIADLLRITTAITAILAFIIALVTWRDSIEYHMDKQDSHIQSQDEIMKSLAKTLADENVNMEKLKDALNKINTRLAIVEEWEKMTAANMKYTR